MQIFFTNRRSASAELRSVGPSIHPAATLRPMEMFFSDLAGRLGGSKNPLYVLHDRLKSEGKKVVDLVRGNVNEHGIVYPVDVLKEILNGSTEAARIYRPDSFGQRVAREAIAQYY